MNRAELERAMADTLAKIEELQEEINAVTDPREKRLAYGVVRKSYRKVTTQD